MIAGYEHSQHLQLIKDLAVDRYCATEIDLVQALGYQRNTSLAEFSGCLQEEHA